MNKVIIDVREPFEFATGHVDGAINIPPSELMAGAKQLQGLDKNLEIILYCRSGSRSRAASMILAQMGFTNIVNGINKDIVEAKHL